MTSNNLTRLDETKRLLLLLGMDDQRRNDRSALTFMALAHVSEDIPWSDSTNGMYGTLDIMGWMRDELGKDYAPNSRETIRRFSLHQFVIGGIVELNADDPKRAVNSSKNNYRITPTLMPVLHAYGKPGFKGLLDKFLSDIQTLKEQQEATRIMNRVPVRMPDGTEAHLSAGGQNVLIKGMVEEFCSRFAPGGIIVYIDDTDHAHGETAVGLLNDINISIPKHGKAPDLIVWQPDKRWLFLMEACSTHGPIDVTRKEELEQLFPCPSADVIYVSCFPDRSIMRKYLIDLAWETEAWCADTPDHMVHLDGKKFLGPYHKTSVVRKKQ